ncbi:MAG: DUF4412 domain-containing protein [Gammaproteobacteria bacterium]|nr:DUF4412 domain-containing protein [Gammaproteobacteria bacterium]
MKNMIESGLIFSGCLIALSVHAFEIGAEFSAEAVQSMPGRPPMNAMMYVSKNAVRTESTVNGNGISEIIFTRDKRRILLNHITKTYIEQKTNNNVNKKNDDSPCAGIVQAKCKKLGKEKVNGRDASKWEMTISVNGQEMKSLHWLDKKYRMPLRQQFQDGTVSTMTLSGKDTIDNRNTEKWDIHAMRPDGQSMQSQQWYDPQLKMVIREVLPGGYVRELKNIKVSNQDKKLFQVPNDYKKETINNLNHPGVMMQNKGK